MSGPILGRVTVGRQVDIDYIAEEQREPALALAAGMGLTAINARVRASTDALNPSPNELIQPPRVASHASDGCNRKLGTSNRCQDALISLRGHSSIRSVPTSSSLRRSSPTAPKSILQTSLHPLEYSAALYSLGVEKMTRTSRCM